MSDSAANSCHTLWWITVPAFLAYGYGVINFGDLNEVKRLQAHNAFYQKEMSAYKQELYYS